MPPFVNLDILYLINCPILLFVFAENTGMILVQDPHAFVDDHQLNFASVHKHYSKDEDQNGDEVLPPVPLAVALEEHSVLAES